MSANPSDIKSKLTMQANNIEADHFHFANRHIGPDSHEQQRMLETLKQSSLEGLIKSIVPESIYDDSPLDLDSGISEQDALAELKKIASKNQVMTSLIGMGYHNTHTPGVILRNVFENPGWYTAYTPYQPEISQGRLEALLNYQTMVCDLSGMEIANASLLDEATAAPKQWLYASA